jgi:hypothetical protein
MNFKATEEELHQANIKIDDKVVRVSGGGYVGVLSVYHELHCLVSYIASLHRHSANALIGSIEEVDFEVGILGISIDHETEINQGTLLRQHDSQWARPR